MAPKANKRSLPKLMARSARYWAAHLGYGNQNWAITSKDPGTASYRNARRAYPNSFSSSRVIARRACSDVHRHIGVDRVSVGTDGKEYAEIYSASNPNEKKLSAAILQD